jgi:hypothetical protein
MKKLLTLLFILFCLPSVFAIDGNVTAEDSQGFFSDYLSFYTNFADQISVLGINMFDSIASLIVGGTAGLNGDYETQMENLDDAIKSGGAVDFDFFDDIEEEVVNTGDSINYAYDEFNATKTLYLKQYQSDKETKLENITLSWSLITSTYIILFEMVYIAFQLGILYLFVWLFIDLLPQSLIFARRQMFLILLGNYKRRIKK